MNRLTEKRGNFYYDKGECVCTECSDKLGKLEDIEEQRKVDLIVLNKALNEGFYFKKYKNEMEEMEETGNYDILFACPSKYTVVNFWYNTIEIYVAPKWKIDYSKNLEINYPAVEGEVWFKDYGKTWALSREELEK